MPAQQIYRKPRRAQSLDDTSIQGSSNSTTVSLSNQSIIDRMGRTVEQNAIGSAAGDLAIGQGVAMEPQRALMQRTFRHAANPIYYDNRWWWKTSNYSNIKDKGLRDIHEDSEKSIGYLIEIGLMLMNNAKVISSFGAADGGFNFAMALRDEIYQRIIKKSSATDPIAVYLDAQSMIVHPATAWPWSRFVGAPGMANPFWDIMYHAGVQNSDIMIFNISEAWLRSAYCYEELQMFRERKAHDDSFPGLFIFNQDSRDIISKPNQELIREGAKYGPRDRDAMVKELNDILKLKNVHRIDVMENSSAIPVTYQVDEVVDFRGMKPDEMENLTEDDLTRQFKKTYSTSLKFVIDSGEMDKIAEVIKRVIR